MLPAGPNPTAHATAEQDNHSNHVLTALKADPPTSSPCKPETASATGIRPHAANSFLADAHSDRRLVPALLEDQLQAPGSGVEALLAGQTETTPHKDPAAAACVTTLRVELLSAGAQDTCVQLPTAPQTDPPTDRQTRQAPASVSPTAVVTQTVSTYSAAAEEVKPAVEAPVNPELSRQADDLAQAPAGPDVSPALASGKAQTSLGDAVLIAGLASSPPQPTGRASAMASREDVLMAPATGVGAEPTAASLAVGTDGLLPEAPETAAAALKPCTVDEAVSANADGSDAQALPAAEAAKEAAAQEAAVPADQEAAVPADALKAATTTAEELQKRPGNEVLASSSVPQMVASSLQDPVGVPPAPPIRSPPKQPPPCNLAVRSGAALNSAAQASAHSPDHWWKLCQTAGLAAGLAKEAATAQASAAPSPDQEGAQVGASMEASFRAMASVPLLPQASIGAASMDTAVREQASGPSSHKVPHPAANSLRAPSTEKVLAAAPLDQADDPAADPAQDPARNPLHAQVFTPPWAGPEATNANPSITADRPAGSDVHVAAADQQLAAGEPAGQQPAPPAPAGASPSAVAPAVAAAVKSQPKRAARSRQSAAAKEAAAPAASLTAMTMSEKGRGAELVGQRIEVWWSGEKKYLPGVVKAFNPFKVPPFQDLVSSGLTQTAQSTVFKACAT